MKNALIILGLALLAFACGETMKPSVPICACSHSISRISQSK